MNTKLLIGIGCLMLNQLSLAESFEYRIWNNKEGKGIEAKIDHVIDSESLVIQAKNGGKRYTIKKSTLADDSKEYLETQVSEVKKSLMEATRINGDLIYKGTSLQMCDETAKAMEKSPFL